MPCKTVTVPAPSDGGQGNDDGSNDSGNNNQDPSPTQPEEPQDNSESILKDNLPIVAAGAAAFVALRSRGGN